MTISFPHVSYMDALRGARAAERTPDAGKKTVSAAIGGNCNADFCLPGLKLGLDRRGYRIAATAHPPGAFVPWAMGTEERPDFAIYWLSSFAGSMAETQRPDLDIGSLAAAARRLIAMGTRVIVVMPEVLRAEALPWSPFGAWRRALSLEAEQALTPEAIRIHVEDIQIAVGPGGWHSPRYWASARAACHPDGATRIGERIAVAIAQTIKPAIKAVCVDLDNTLWGGVAGDDGPQGLSLDPFGEGHAFAGMQRFLLDLRGNGIPLAIVSKNDRSTVDQIFAERAPDLLVKQSDFFEIYCSWANKHLALADFAETLNIGLDTLAFIDDSPHERAEARSALPSLVIPELPEDPDARVAFLASTGLFDMPAVSKDDAARAARYEQDKARRTGLKTGSDLGSYLASLAMVLGAKPLNGQNLARAVALIQKTNQFNVTGRRHLGPAVEALAEDAENYARVFSLKDQFGGSGEISVLIGKRAGAVLEIDNWVLSCRVFGRGVEDAIFGDLVSWCQARGIARIVTEFLRTERNGLLVDKLAGWGFSASGGGAMSVETSAAVVPKHYLGIETGS
jgi:FkbH-like protein